MDYGKLKTVGQFVTQLQAIDQSLPITLDGCEEVGDPHVKSVFPGGNAPAVPVVTLGVEWPED